MEGELLSSTIERGVLRTPAGGKDTRSAFGLRARERVRSAGLSKAGIALLFSTLVGASAFGQSGPSPSFDPNDQPHTASGIDSVNPYNGQLSLAIPIGPVYTVGPGLSFQIRLLYSSRVWEPGQWQIFTVGQPPEPNMLLRGNPAFGLGWSFSLGQIVESSAAGVPAAYISPDGSAHRLYNRRVYNAGNPDGFFYTRDGSYVRVKYVNATSGYQMWTADGNLTTFDHKVVGYDNAPGNYVSDYGRGRNGWYPKKIENPYGDAVTIAYHANPEWVPATITVPAIGTGQNRTLTTTISNGRVASFSVPTADGTATYNLFYSTHGTLQRPIAHPSTSPSPQYLDRIDLPNAGYSSSYSFTYHDGFGSLPAYARGSLESQTLPTGARVDYGYGTWTWYHANPLNRPVNCGYPISPYPTNRPILKTGPNIEPSSLPHVSDCGAPDRAGGIVERTVSYSTHNATDTAVTRWVHYDYPEGESDTGSSAETQTLVVSPPASGGRVTSTTHLFSSSTAQGISGPLVGALLRTAVFDGDASAGNGPSTSSALRVQRFTYEMDAYDTSVSVTPSSEAFDANRRVKQSVTIYNSISPGQGTPTGRWHQIDYVFDANAGRYLRETHSGNVGSDARVLETTWAPLIDATRWKLDVAQELRLKRAAADPNFSRVANTFDASGFVTSSTTTDGSGANAGTLRRDSPRDADGFPDSETFVHGSSTYTRDVSFEVGVLKVMRWSRFNYDVLNLSVDPATGLVTSSRDPNGLETQFTYDKFGRPRVTTPPAGDAVTTVTYNSPTLSESKTDKSGTEYAWGQVATDSLGRPVRIKRRMPGGTIAKRIIAYDKQGNTSWESEWLADSASESSPPRTLFEDFDNFGRAKKITTADGKSTSIDYSDGGTHPASVWRRKVTIHDLGGSASDTVFVSDAFGNLTTVTEPGGLGDTTYEYDPLDRLTKVTQGSSQTRTYTWDAFGFLRKEKIPERNNQEVTYAYDAVGNLLSATAPGSVSIQRSFTFDAAGRLKEATGGSSLLVKYEYDTTGSCTGDCPDNGLYPKGRVVRRTGYNPSLTPALQVVEEFTYRDGAGRLSARKTRFLPGTFAPVEKWIYDPAGSIVGYSHPRTSGLFMVATQYDHGLPLEVRANGLPVVSGVTYHLSGMLNQYRTGNGSGPAVTTTIAQDGSIPRPLQISTSGADFNFATGAYSYDGAGNITNIGSDSFSYDRVSRLTRAVLDTAGTQDFNYDRYGNLTSKTGPNGRTWSVSSTTNRLNGSGAAYDTRGNLTAINNGNGSETYTWDGLDRMSTYLQGAGSPWKYYYGGDGERLAKISPSGTDTYYTLRDEGLRVATEFHNGLPTRDNVYLGGLLVGTYQSCTANGVPGWQYYSSDHLGTPRLVTDASATRLDARKYWPYGDEASVTLPTSSQRVRFAGMERDINEIATRYFDHARSYDYHPVGRFLGVDLVGGSPADPQSLNRYSYVFGNPLNLIDPFGLEASGFGAGCAATTGGSDECSLTLSPGGGGGTPNAVFSGFFDNGQFIATDDFTSQGVLSNGGTSFFGSIASAFTNNSLPDYYQERAIQKWEQGSYAAAVIDQLGAELLPRNYLSPSGLLFALSVVGAPQGRVGSDILVLGRGPVARLQRLAAKEGGRISTIASTVPRVIWKNIYRDLRSATQIVQYMDDVPRTLSEALRMGGQYSRAEWQVINSRPDLLAKTRRLFERP